MNIGENNSLRRWVRTIVSLVICLSIIFTIEAPAYADVAKCSVSFRGNTETSFKRLTPNQWSDIIGPTWVDKGYHFYSRLRQPDRGAANEIYTPSDLESAMRGGIPSSDPTSINRYRITLKSLPTNKEKYPYISYDYNPKTKQCEFVTLAYEGERG